MKKIFFSIFICLPFIWSCNNTENQEQNDVDSVEIEIDTLMNEVSYQIPSPDEFFSLISNKDLTFKKDIIRNNQGDFSTRWGKEVNLGIYIADMAYLMTFGELKLMVNYFSKVRELSDQIGLSAAIPEEMMKKLDANSDKVDSLRKISDDSFYNITQALEDAGNGQSLAVIMASGWVESIYIALKLNEGKKFDSKNSMIQSVSSQKITYNNIIKNLEKYNEDSNVKQLVVDLQVLDGFYSQLSKDTLETQKQDPNSNVIGKKSLWKIEEPQFNEFSKNLSLLRNKLIQLN